MGVFISWLSLTHLRGGFVFVDGAGNAGTSVDYLMRVGDIGTLLACAVLANRIGRLSEHRSFCIVAVVLGTLGTLLAPIALHLGSPALLAAASVCAGASEAATATAMVSPQLAGLVALPAPAVPWHCFCGPRYTVRWAQPDAWSSGL